MAFCLKGKHKLAQGNALGIDCHTIPVALKGQYRALVRRETANQFCDSVRFDLPDTVTQNRGQGTQLSLSAAHR